VALLKRDPGRLPEQRSHGGVTCTALDERRPKNKDEAISLVLFFVCHTLVAQAGRVDGTGNFPGPVRKILLEAEP